MHVKRCLFFESKKQKLHLEVNEWYLGSWLSRGFYYSRLVSDCNLASVSFHQSFPQDLMTETSNKLAFRCPETTISFTDLVGLRVGRNFTGCFVFLCIITTWLRI